MTRIRAIAHANIALAKYWGKSDASLNLPAVPSLSLTLAGLRTQTDVGFDAALDEDRVWLDGRELDGRPRERVVTLLDRVRQRAGRDEFARVESRNEFPTAAGLASSASGFAALALAALRAAGLEPSDAEVSSLARWSSASAARSVFGGWATLGAGQHQAEALAPPDYIPVEMLVVETARGPKAVGSTEGMRHTRATSPYYAAWVSSAPATFERARQALLTRELAALGAAMEHSTLCMHACMLAADPALVYPSPVSWAVIERVRALRSDGALAYFTMDAGPHVKVLTTPEQAGALSAELLRVPGVVAAQRCLPGPAASWERLE